MAKVIVKPEMIKENGTMSMDVYRCLKISVMDEWMKENHKELKDWWVDLCNGKHDVERKVRDENGKVKKENNVELTELQKDVVLTVFEIKDKFIEKFNITLDRKVKEKDVRKNVGNW